MRNCARALRPNPWPLALCFGLDATLLEEIGELADGRTATASLDLVVVEAVFPALGVGLCCGGGEGVDLHEDADESVLVVEPRAGNTRPGTMLSGEGEKV